MKRTIMTALCACVLLASGSAFAQETTTATDELIGILGEAVVQEAAEANENVRKAKEIYEQAKQAGTRAEQEAAKQEVEEAEQEQEEASAKLDDARADALAEQSGRSRAEIQAMRDSGMGWGRIAKELDVHPSAMGKGKG